MVDCLQMLWYVHVKARQGKWRHAHAIMFADSLPLLLTSLYIQFLVEANVLVYVICTCV